MKTPFRHHQGFQCLTITAGITFFLRSGFSFFTVTITISPTIAEDNLLSLPLIHFLQYLQILYTRVGTVHRQPATSESCSTQAFYKGEWINTSILQWCTDQIQYMYRLFEPMSARFTVDQQHPKLVQTQVFYNGVWIKYNVINVFQHDSIPPILKIQTNKARILQWCICQVQCYNVFNIIVKRTTKIMQYFIFQNN